MSFIEKARRPSNTATSPEQFEAARAIIQQVLLAYAPDWRATEKSCFGRLWLADTDPAVELLTDITLHINALHLSSDSASHWKLRKKFLELLSIDDERRFDELITEMRVGVYFAARARSLEIEPLVPNDIVEGADHPVSPDYAIPLGAGRLNIEVTTLRVEEIDRWFRSMRDLERRIHSELGRTSVFLDVEVRAPIEVQADSISSGQLRRLVRGAARVPTGSKTIVHNSVPVEFRWSTIPVQQREEPSAESQSGPQVWPFGESPVGMIFSNKDQIASLSVTRVRPLWSDSPRERVVKSLRNTLDKKRRQLPDGQPSMIVIEIGSDGIDPGLLAQLLNERIWNNPQYRWLQAIGIYVPRKSYNRGAPRHGLAICWNHSCVDSKRADIGELLEREADFLPRRPVDGA